MLKRRKKVNSIKIFSFIFISVYAVFCLYPILMAIAVSFTNEKDIIKNGYLLFNKNFTLTTYKYVIDTIGFKIVKSYKITIFVTIIGTLTAMVVSSCYAYAASVKNFKHRNLLNLLCYIPMVFNAGLLPWYIVLSRYYHLTDKIAALVLPAAMNLWNVFLIRNFMGTIPVELSEAAKIDGAGHFRIFAQIVIPVARVGLITVAMFYILSFWNEWYLSLMFIRNPDYYQLQYLLYNMLSDAKFFSNSSNVQLAANLRPPLETAKMAVTCITIGPIILLYPFAQKYFVKGIVVGAVKG